MLSRLLLMCFVESVLESLFKLSTGFLFTLNDLPLVMLLELFPSTCLNLLGSSLESALNSFQIPFPVGISPYVPPCSGHP